MTGAFKAFTVAVSDGSADNGFHFKRLEELALPSNNHTWLWNVVDQHGGAIQDPGEFTEAVRVRLGCGGPSDAVLCGACSQAVMDDAGRHASTCCLGEATRGHNRCVENLLACAQQLDSESVMEPRELVPSQGHLRPADILTAAARRLTAVDLGVTSPATSTSSEKQKRLCSPGRLVNAPLLNLK